MVSGARLSASFTWVNVVNRTCKSSKVRRVARVCFRRFPFKRLEDKQKNFPLSNEIGGFHTDIQFGGVPQPCRLNRRVNHRIKITLYPLIERHFIVFYDPGEDRTHDLHPVKVALSLLSYGIFKNAYVTASLIIMLKQLYIIN